MYDARTMQRGILESLPSVGRHLFFRLSSESDARAALTRLVRDVDGTATVLGIGAGLASKLEVSIDGLHEFPVFEGAKVSMPSTPSALWLFLRGSDQGEVALRAAHFVERAAPDLVLEDSVDVFKYDTGRDLTGYEDGTENPKDEKAVAVAFLVSDQAGMNGASFAAVQRWVHDLRHFRSFDAAHRDAIVGRRQEDNEELADAPASAHVKRAAQESFDPEAFMLRRSLPYSDARGDGLLFLAFGESLNAFERVARRMVGLEDGIVDALFKFTRPVTGHTFFCPPVVEGKLDLRALGL